MPESLYNAINGQEAKKLINIKLEEFVNKHIPLLKRGNTFHQFSVYLYFKVSAFPHDVPVPEGEFEFELLADNLKDEESRLRKGFDAFRNNIENLVRLKDEIDDLLKQYHARIEIDDTMNAGDNPNVLRSANNLPLPIKEMNVNTKRVSEIRENEHKIRPAITGNIEFDLDAPIVK
jgi:hypothetical protein